MRVCACWVPSLVCAHLFYILSLIFVSRVVTSVFGTLNRRLELHRATYTTYTGASTLRESTRFLRATR